MPMDHPDAAADYEEICAVMEQKLIPTFELLGQMLQKIQNKADQAFDLASAIVDKMDEAVTGNKRDMFSGLLSEKFGGDLGPLDSFYEDTQGSRFSDALIDELLANNPENPEEYAAGRINETKGKYGKYLGMPPAEAAPEGEPGEAASEEAAPEVAAEEPEGEKPAAAVQVKIKSKPTARDMADMLGLKLNEK